MGTHVVSGNAKVLVVLTEGTVKVESALNVNGTESEKVFLFAYLNDLDPDNVQVELFAIGLNGESPIVQKMTREAKLTEPGKGYHDKRCV